MIKRNKLTVVRCPYFGGVAVPDSTCKGFGETKQCPYFGGEDNNQITCRYDRRSPKKVVDKSGKVIGRNNAGIWTTKDPSYSILGNGNDDGYEWNTGHNVLSE